MPSLAKKGGCPSAEASDSASESAESSDPAPRRASTSCSRSCAGAGQRSSLYSLFVLESRMTRAPEMGSSTSSGPQSFNITRVASPANCASAKLAVMQHIWYQRVFPSGSIAPEKLEKAMHHRSQ